MKKLLNSLFITGLFAVAIISCDKKDNTEPDSFYKQVIIHDTMIVYIDSLVYNPASYFTESYKDTVFDKEGSWKNYPNINLFENRRLVLDTLNNVSMEYKGGWVDRTDPEDSKNLCDCFNDHEYISDYIPGQKIVYDDTIYLRRTVPVSYAIFEITKGSETVTDTAIYGRCAEIKEIHNLMTSYDDFNAYYEKYSDYYYNYTYSMDYNVLQFSENRHKKFFSNFHKLPVKFVNSIGSYDMYLVDIFPYWDTEVSQNTMLFYVYIPDVFLGQ